jgi:alpha-beta hydrolase superfamily lysophospholipase/thiol-disulfide isomerase/thioredoxin
MLTAPASQYALASDLSAQAQSSSRLAQSQSSSLLTQAQSSSWLAQGQSSSAPPQAPSFLRQAGQKLLDSAQKGVINKLDQNLQNQQKQQTNSQSQSSSQYSNQSNSQYSDQSSSQYSNQSNSQYPNQSNSQYSNQSNSQYPNQSNSQYPNQSNSQYPNQSSTPYSAVDINAPITNTVNGGVSTTGSAPTTGTPTVAPERRQAAPCRSWVQPDQPPIACLLCIHGLGLQSNSYEFFGNEQSNRGLAVYAIDVRGFGSWMNAKGKTQVNFDDCLNDIKTALESIHAANPGKPVYLLGESMGGAIALRAASMYPNLVDGLISSVPASERFNQGKTSMKVFLNLLTGLNVANVGNDLVNQATQNQKLKAAWQDDPLARLNLSPQELIQFQDFMNFNHDAAKKVTDMPVLFVQGTGDQLVKPEGTWELFNDVAAKDKSFFAVPGEHLIFEEAQTQDPGPRDQNFRVISSWLSAKVGRRARRNPTTGFDTSGGQGLQGGQGWQAGQGWQGFSGRAAINTVGLEGPAQMIDNKQYGDAVNALEQIRAQKPTDPNVLALLGKAYFQSGAPDKAGPLFRQAMRIRRAGGYQAQAFNSYLLNIGGNTGNTVGTGAASNSGTISNSGTASSGASTGSSAGSASTTNTSTTTTSNTSTQTTSTSPFDRLTNLFGINTTSSAPVVAAPASKAKVYAFYATWADQCKTMNNAMAQLSNAYGDRVEINKVNIEDSANDALTDKFKVGPIPTVVFVTPSGKIGQTIIGETTYNNYARALDAVVKTQ